jgi:hypothetical protein
MGMNPVGKETFIPRVSVGYRPLIGPKEHLVETKLAFDRATEVIDTFIQSDDPVNPDALQVAVSHLLQTADNAGQLEQQHAASRLFTLYRHTKDPWVALGVAIHAERHKNDFSIVSRCIPTLSLAYFTAQREGNTNDEAFWSLTMRDLVTNRRFQ